MDPNLVRLRPRLAEIRRAIPFAVLVLSLLWSLAAGAETVVRQVAGTVEIGRGEPPVWTPLVVGAQVAPEERIRTGIDGRVELAVDAGTLRVHANSLLTLPPASPGVDRVELEAGHSLFDVTRREGHQFEVRTPTVVVSVKGTRFGVEAGEEVGVVTVYRGVVGVHPADAAEIVETLVREGFLATGGADLPIEVEVAPEGDPWSAWQNGQAKADENATRATRESSVEGARQSARRATDADVVKQAVARRPELLERLRAQGRDDATGERSGDPNDAPPASPSILDDGSLQRLANDPIDVLGDTLLGSTDSQQGLIDLQRAEETLRGVIETVDVEAITQGALFPNGQTTATLVDLEGVAVGDIVLLTEALESMETAGLASSVPWTPTDVTSYLENDLIQQGGMDVEVATRLIGLLFGH